MRMLRQCPVTATHISTSGLSGAFDIANFVVEMFQLNITYIIVILFPFIFTSLKMYLLVQLNYRSMVENARKLLDSVSDVAFK